MSQPPAPRRPHAPVTYAIIGVCTVIWLWLNFGVHDAEISPAFLFLAPDSVHIWNGAYWGLLTCAFVHLAWWHILCDLLVFWDFGLIQEPVMGSLPYLLFIAASAVAASSVQVLMGSDGIGISGVVYAMFGYILARKNSDPTFAWLATPRTTRIMLWSLVFCIVLTELNILPIANGAHIGGLLFGWFLGVALETQPLWSYAGLIAMTAAVVMASAWVPWSNSWQNRAQMVTLQNAAAKAAQGNVGAQLLYGQYLAGTRDRKAEGLHWLELAAEAGNIDAMNEVSFLWATEKTPDPDKIQEALGFARKASATNADPNITDTLAAADANAGQWDDAVAAEQRAEDATSSHRFSFQRRLNAYRKHRRCIDDPWWAGMMDSLMSILPRHL